MSFAQLKNQVLFRNLVINNKAKNFPQQKHPFLRLIYFGMAKMDMERILIL